MKDAPVPVQRVTKLALFMDRAIDRHPVMAGLTYLFTAICMIAFVVATW